MWMTKIWSCLQTNYLDKTTNQHLWLESTSTLWECGNIGLDANGSKEISTHFHQRIGKCWELRAKQQQ